MKKNLIYIDANVYLRFYDTESHKFKKLLKTVSELKNNILVTEQIRDEVLRNKLNVTIRSFSNNYKALGMDHAAFPEHLENAGADELAAWNKKRRNLMGEEKLLRSEYNNIVSRTLTQIAISSDNVSKELDQIFTLAKPPSVEEMERARLRKDRGNPPGKVSDPLGDQLSWEQLLTCYTGQSLWIVTNDSDYLSTYGEALYLNPSLYRDLVQISDRSNPSVYLFRSLPEALDDFRKKTGKTIKALPKANEMKKIIIEEMEVLLYPSIMRDLVDSSNIKSVGYDSESSTLKIEFSHGSTYQYCKVPEEIYLMLLKSASKGIFFLDFIKRGGYSYERID